MSGGVHVVGSVPIADLAALTKAAGRDAVMSPDLARLAGASFAWGRSHDVDALIATMRQDALRQLDGEPGDESDPAVRLQRWMLLGDRGYPYPHDPDDLRRCLLLLRDVPSLAGRIGEMADCSRQWAALVAAWDELASLLSSEITPEHWDRPPRGSRSPKTYARMQELLGSVESAS